MVLKREVVERRLEELDRILEELSRHRDASLEEYRSDLSLQWIVERGLLAAAGVVFDVSDHVLSGHFGEHAETYEGSLRLLHERGVIDSELYDLLDGLGGFRNVLVHRYLDIDPEEVYSHYETAFEAFPRFATRVLGWMDRIGDRENEEQESP